MSEAKIPGYSEATQRCLDKYTRKLVRCQPKWLQELFNSDQMFFVVEEDCSLGVHAATEIPNDVKERASTLIVRYIDKNPCPAFQSLDVKGERVH